MSYRKIFRPAIAATLAAVSLGALLSSDFSSEATQAPKISLDMDPTGNTYTPSVDADRDGIPDPGTNAMAVGTIDNCLSSIPGNNAEHSHPVHLIVQDVEDLSGWQVRINFDGARAAPANVNFQPFIHPGLGSEPLSFLNLPVDDKLGGGHRPIYGAQEVLNPTGTDATTLFGAAALGEQTFGVAPDVPAKSPHDETARTYSVGGGGVLASLDFVTRAGQEGQSSLRLDLDDGNPNLPGSKADIFDGSGLKSIEIGANALGDGFHAEGVAECTIPTPTPTPLPPTPPANDNIADATGIAALPYTDIQSTAGATNEPGEPSLCAGNAVWYSFTPSADGVLEANTAGSDFDTVLGVYRGTSLDTLTLVDCDDDSLGPQSRLRFLSHAGETVYIQAGGFLGTRGKLTFNLREFNAPANDDFPGSVIENLPFTATQNTAAATLDSQEPMACGSVGATVWYSFTPSRDMSIVADTFGSNFDTVLAAYTGTSLVTLIPITCGQSRITLIAGAGATYYFQLGGAFGDTGNLAFNVATSPPTPTPGPQGPTPRPQPGPERFNPQVSETFSDTSSGSHPDISRSLSIGLGPDGRRFTPDDTNDYNFGGIVNFLPSSPRDADIPDSAITGNANANLVLGLINSGCSTWIPAGFTFMEATTDIANSVEPLPYGSSNELSPLGGDHDQDGNPDVQPPPAVTKYPSYLNAIFDPDWVDFGPDKIAGNGDDNNGPAPPLRPRARFAAATSIPSVGNLWMVIQEVVFEPGTRLPGLPAFDSALGYPSVIVVQQDSAGGSASPSPLSAITDFCTPLDVTIQSFGVTRDNPNTPANEGAVNVRTLPSDVGTTITTMFVAFSQRDADGDGYENSLDPCPFHADTVWDPRANPPMGDGAENPDAGGFFLHDGIPDTCDPTPTEATSGLPGSPGDHDGDGFMNRADNCPVHSNPDQADSDVNDWGEIAGDGIGDVCDTPGTDPGTDSAGRPTPGPRTVSGNGSIFPDGERLLCIRALAVTVGGANEAASSECQQDLPGTVPVCSCAPASTPAPQTADVTAAGESVLGPAPAPTAAVAGVSALPRTGEGAGSALPGQILALALAGLAAGTAAAGLRAWRMRKN